MAFVLVVGRALWLVVMLVSQLALLKVPWLVEVLVFLRAPL